MQENQSNCIHKLFPRRIFSFAFTIVPVPFSNCIIGHALLCAISYVYSCVVLIWHRSTRRSTEDIESFSWVLEIGVLIRAPDEWQLRHNNWYRHIHTFQNDIDIRGCEDISSFWIELFQTNIGSRAKCTGRELVVSLLFYYKCPIVN